MKAASSRNQSVKSIFLRAICRFCETLRTNCLDTERKSHPLNGNIIKLNNRTLTKVSVLLLIKTDITISRISVSFTVNIADEIEHLGRTS